MLGRAFSMWWDFSEHSCGFSLSVTGIVYNKPVINLMWTQAHKLISKVTYFCVFFPKTSLFTLFRQSWGSLVGIVTKLQAVWLRNHHLSHGSRNRFLQSFETRFETYLAFYSKGTEDSFLEGKTSRMWSSPLLTGAQVNNQWSHTSKPIFLHDMHNNSFTAGFFVIIISIQDTEHDRQLDRCCKLCKESLLFFLYCGQIFRWIWISFSRGIIFNYVIQ
jgi:hypothetical protein